MSIICVTHWNHIQTLTTPSANLPLADVQLKAKMLCIASMSSPGHAADVGVLVLSKALNAFPCRSVWALCPPHSCDFEDFHSVFTPLFTGPVSVYDVGVCLWKRATCVCVIMVCECVHAWVCVLTRWGRVREVRGNRGSVYPAPTDLDWACLVSRVGPYRTLPPILNDTQMCYQKTMSVEK